MLGNVITVKSEESFRPRCKFKFSKLTARSGRNSTGHIILRAVWGRGVTATNAPLASVCSMRFCVFVCGWPALTGGVLLINKKIEKNVFFPCSQE